jgi:hypothetical protein
MQPWRVCPAYCLGSPKLHHLIVTFQDSRCTTCGFDPLPLTTLPTCQEQAAPPKRVRSSKVTEQQAIQALIAKGRPVRPHRPHGGHHPPHLKRYAGSASNRTTAASPAVQFLRRVPGGHCAATRSRVQRPNANMPGKVLAMDWADMNRWGGPDRRAATKA